ncbi:TPA: ead/Ea22-like family protein [Klebsiella pneumoniae]
MTDITELAQSLKAAADNAIGAHERLSAYPYGEIIDISQHEGEQIDIDITDLNEFNKEANPVNILALVEALEKAQRYIEELREWNAGLAQESCERQQRISELLEGKVGNALLERENHHVELVGKLTESIASQREYYEGVIADGGKRIAELESRVVTVKLPQRHSMLLREDFNEDYHTEMAFKADEVQASLAAAGIKVEAE